MISSPSSQTCCIHPGFSPSPELACHYNNKTANAKSIIFAIILNANFLQLEERQRNEEKQRQALAIKWKTKVSLQSEF